MTKGLFVFSCGRWLITTGPVPILIRVKGEASHQKEDDGDEDNGPVPDTNEEHKALNDDCNYPN